MSIENQVFEVQKKHKIQMKNTSALYRLEKIKKLKSLILEKKDQINEALALDFHKPHLETELAEIMPVLGMLNLLEKELIDWMSDERVASPLLFKGTKNWIRKEGKGNSLIISPWNYPFQLTVYPVVTAFAAGNTSIVKPSEFTPHTNKIIIEIFNEVFEQKEVCILEGEVELSTKLLKMPFDHVFFTGSTSVGKIVMKAASEHLASVVLELGGKSPVIVDKGCDIEKAAKKIMWGKILNAGQTCVAPDYVLVHSDDKEKFINASKKFVEEVYQNELESSDDYSHIITQRHADRLKDLIEDAKKLGAKVEFGDADFENQRVVAPTILSEINSDMKIMQDEIFGPVLPLITYDSIDSAIEYVNQYDNALAMYIFSNSKPVMNKIMDNTFNGGVTVNDVLIGVSHPTLPFGGAGKSGIGKYHGKHGFDSFSNLRSVTRRDMDLGTSYFYPPYTQTKYKIVNSLLKKFSSLF